MTNLVDFPNKTCGYKQNLLCLEVANSTNSVLMAWICHRNLNVENQMFLLLVGDQAGSG